MMTTRTRRLMLAGTAVTLAVALTGCSTIQGLLNGTGSDVERDEETGAVAEEANIGIFNLKVGDCKMEDAAGLIEDTDVVPCDQPHDEEVYFEFTLPEGDLPSDDEINTAVAEQCIPAFESYVGVPYDENTLLDIYPITPTQDTWDQLNDRIVQCVVYHQQLEQLTGSVKGAGAQYAVAQ